MHDFDRGLNALNSTEVNKRERKIYNNETNLKCNIM